MYVLIVVSVLVGVGGIAGGIFACVREVKRRREQARAQARAAMGDNGDNNNDRSNHIELHNVGGRNAQQQLAIPREQTVVAAAAPIPSQYSVDAIPTAQTTGIRTQQTVEAIAGLPPAVAVDIAAIPVADGAYVEPARGVQL